MTELAESNGEFQEGTAAPLVAVAEAVPPPSNGAGASRNVRPALLEDDALPAGGELRHAAFVPPRGLFRDYLDYVKPVTDAPASFHVGAILSVAGHVLNRRVWMQWGVEKLHPHLWVALVSGQPNLRRSTVLRLAQDLLKDASTPMLSSAFTLRQWIETLGWVLRPGSDPGSCKPEEKEPRSASKGTGWCAIEDIGSWLRRFDVSCNRNARDYLANWQRVPEQWTQTSRAGLSLLEHPCISLLGAASTAWLKRLIQDAKGIDDFWNNWLFVAAHDKESSLLLPKPPSVEQKRVVLKELSGLHLVRGEMTLSGEARRFYKEWLSRQDHGPLQHWLSQRGTAALKIAMLYEAVMTGECLISEYAVHLATALLDEWIAQWELVPDLMGDEAEVELVESEPHVAKGWSQRTALQRIAEESDTDENEAVASDPEHFDGQRAGQEMYGQAWRVFQLALRWFPNFPNPDDGPLCH